jgi:hypothetical protein
MAHQPLSRPSLDDPAPPPHGSAHLHRHGVRRRVRSIWQHAPLWVHILIVAAGASLAIGVVFVSANWPYRHRKIRPMLEDVLTSDVTFSKFHRIYFPHPGFVATGVTIRRKSAPPGLPPLGHIDTLVFEGTWGDLIALRRRIALIDITGFHIIVPAIGSPENQQSFPNGSSKEFSGPDAMIGRMLVHNSLLEIMEGGGKKLSFPIQQIELRNLHKGEAMTFAIDMKNPIPTGHILARGSFGPIHGREFDLTPISGSFAFTGANLHDVGEISGSLNSRGMFKGTLQSMNVEASGITPNFAVTDGKTTPINGSIQGTFHASTGELEVHSIDLNVRQTTVHATGTINDPKTATNLDINVEHGRAEDLMRPFIHDEVPISGPVSLKTHAYLGPSGNGFMQRLRMNGAFFVPAEKITNTKTENSLSAFSERAAGEQKNTGLGSSPDSKPPGAQVLSSLKGPVKIEDGVVHTRQIVFRVPGAEAILAGTFRFSDEAVHMTGNLRMKTDISHTSTGFKSFLLKFLAPFFRKKHAGAVIPIAVTGLPGHYKISQDITHTK